MKFPESEHAHRWLDPRGVGVEIGGSSHNPFNVRGCLNIDYTDDMGTIFKAEEARLCGEKLPVDRVDDGDTLATFATNSLDYILSSHVFEHFPNPFKALDNWWRVLKPGGVAYAVVPHRDALEEDADRPLTSIAHVLRDYLDGATVDTHPLAPGHGKRGHYHVFDVFSFGGMIKAYNLVHRAKRFEVVDRLSNDDKVGNGFVIVIRALK